MPREAPRVQLDNSFQSRTKVIVAQTKSFHCLTTHIIVCATTQKDRLGLTCQSKLTFERVQLPIQSQGPYSIPFVLTPEPILELSVYAIGLSKL